MEIKHMREASAKGVTEVIPTMRRKKGLR